MESRAEPRGCCFMSIMFWLFLLPAHVLEDHETIGGAGRTVVGTHQNARVEPSEEFSDSRTWIVPFVARLPKTHGPQHHTTAVYNTWVHRSVSFVPTST